MSLPLPPHKSTDKAERLPPGQRLTEGFPVLSAGPTPHLPLDRWTFTLEGLVTPTITWTWDEFLKLPSQRFVVDISCVTRWTKLDTEWEGVSVETLLEHTQLAARAQYAVAFSYGGYTTNLPLADLRNRQAFVAFTYAGQPLAPEHGGPARLVVPHLYFWKSAKWVAGIRFVDQEQPGFWESIGYHNHGDPWKEERYRGSR
jgi:DMSO/TMAO reductase YedYZ molybdopterin-dependent catalytic subunit